MLLSYLLDDFSEKKESLLREFPEQGFFAFCNYGCLGISEYFDVPMKSCRRNGFLPLVSRTIYRYFSTSARTSFMFSVGSNRATTFPFRSIKNFVKFHLISALFL